MGRSKYKGGLSFRNLECFNLILLAKQLWRIMTHPDSLAASILKEKYFRNVDIFSARAKNISSMLWKSILAAQEPVDKDTR